MARGAKNSRDSGHKNQGKRDACGQSLPALGMERSRLTGRFAVLARQSAFDNIITQLIDRVLWGGGEEEDGLVDLLLDGISTVAAARSVESQITPCTKPQAPSTHHTPRGTKSRARKTMHQGYGCGAAEIRAIATHPTADVPD